MDPRRSTGGTKKASIFAVGAVDDADGHQRARPGRAETRETGDDGRAGGSRGNLDLGEADGVDAELRGQQPHLVAGLVTLLADLPRQLQAELGQHLRVRPAGIEHELLQLGILADLGGREHAHVVALRLERGRHARTEIAGELAARVGLLLGLHDLLLDEGGLRRQEHDRPRPRGARLELPGGVHRRVRGRTADQQANDEAAFQ